MTFFPFMVRAAAISLPMNPHANHGEAIALFAGRAKPPVIGHGAEINYLIVVKRKTPRPYRR